MVTRKGLGKNRGMGYKNIIPRYDSHRHSLNAQGYRMPQRMPNMVGGKARQPFDLTKLKNEFADFKSNLSMEASNIDEARIDLENLDEDDSLREVQNKFPLTDVDEYFHDYLDELDDKLTKLEKAGMKKSALYKKLLKHEKAISNMTTMHTRIPDEPDNINDAQQVASELDDYLVELNNKRDKIAKLKL